MDLNNAFINGYDLIIFAIIIIANIVFYKKFQSVELSNTLGCFVHLTLFVLFF